MSSTCCMASRRNSPSSRTSVWMLTSFFKIHGKVHLGLGTFFGALAILAHQDERPLKTDQDRKNQIEEHERVRVERRP